MTSSNPKVGEINCKPFLCNTWDISEQLSLTCSLSIPLSLPLQFSCCFVDAYKAIREELKIKSVSVAALGRCLNLLLAALCHWYWRSRKKLWQDLSLSGVSLGKRVTSIYFFQTGNPNSTFDLLVLTTPINSSYLCFLLSLSLLPLSYSGFCSIWHTRTKVSSGPSGSCSDAEDEEGHVLWWILCSFLFMALSDLLSQQGRRRDLCNELKIHRKKW